MYSFMARFPSSVSRQDVRVLFPHELLGHRDIACTAQFVQLYTDIAGSSIGLLLQVIGMNV